MFKIRYWIREIFSLFIKFCMTYRRAGFSIDKWNEKFMIDTLWYPGIVARSATLRSPFLPVIRKFPLAFWYLKKYLLREAKKNKDQCLIVCFPHELFDFFNKKIVPFLEKPFIFLSMEMDEPASRTLAPILASPKLGHVFCIDNDLHPHDRVTGVPLGINFHERMVRPGAEWKNKLISAQEQEMELLKIAKEPLKEKPIDKVYCSFHKNITHPRRQELYDMLCDNPLFYFKTVYPRSDFWRNARKYQFMFCVRGLAYEVLRTWEALALGIIPIVEDDPISYLYEGLPVVVISSPQDITAKNLSVWKKQMLPRFASDAMQTLTNTYWIQQIKTKQKEIETQCA